jgi:PAS domain S-box-containing protein
VLFDSSPDSLVRYGPDIRATHVNASFENATGIASKDIVGKPIHDLPVPSGTDVEAVESLVRSVFATGLPKTVFAPYPTLQGVREFEVRYIPEFAADRSIAAVFSIARDITEQKKLQDLAAANARDIRALTARLITSQEQERRRMARDIHDSLCQHLGILAAEIEAIAASFPASNATGERLQAARKQALSIADEARQVARQLHPSILEDLGLPQALQNLCNEFRKREGISVHFRVLNKYRPVPIDAASCAYRIAQEAFNNIARHARAKKVTALLSVRRDLLLSIRDDGAGFDPGAVQGSGGLGLVSMWERARLANGKLSVDATPGHGTRIKLALHLGRSAS